MTRPSFAAHVAAGRPVVLDGGLATLLERHGHDLSSALWSARLLVDDPAAIARAHTAFFAAGARVATTATYQASADGLRALGFDDAGVDELLRRGVAVADRARQEHEESAGRPAWVAVSVGPYGAALADGSEYRGDYSLDVAALRRWHHRRLAVLAGTVADGTGDVLALETIPCAAEVDALLAELDGTGVPAWLSLTAAVRDGRAVTRAGEDLAAVARAAADVAEVVAIGVNCVDPRELPVLLAATAAAGRPGVCYPNSGEVWDAVDRRWHGRPVIDETAAAGWRAAGASLVGGCCRVGPELIAVLAA